MSETVNYTMMQIPNGPEGVRATLKMMSGLVKKYKSNPTVRELAIQLTMPRKQKDFKGEVRLLHQFVRDKIRYVKDIVGVETLQTPVQTLRIGAGDCDDKSILVAAFLESLGHPTRFVAVGFQRGSYSHVLVQTKLGSKWVSVECTEPVQLGWFPPRVRTVMMQHN